MKEVVESRQDGGFIYVKYEQNGKKLVAKFPKFKLTFGSLCTNCPVKNGTGTEKF